MTVKTKYCKNDLKENWNPIEKKIFFYRSFEDLKICAISRYHLHIFIQLPVKCMKTVALCMRGYSQKYIVLNTCIMTVKFVLL